MLYGFGRPGQLLLHALYSPPDVILHKGLRFVARETNNRLRPLRERARCAYPSVEELRGGLSSRLPAVSRAAIEPLLPALQALIPLYLDHRFDLLGSGWIRVAHGETYAGFSGHRYGPSPALSPGRWRSELTEQLPPGSRARALALLRMIDDPHYQPIDWHVDFKSGYRWHPAQWGRNIPFDSRPGVDFKMPLELARMHHLPHLALAYAAGGGDALPREFRNQLLDFLGANPPGWGINWILAMDVAIRAANILMARDLFRAAGAIFDDAFEIELAAAMLAHGRFIVEFLEWHDNPRGNHYLSDIAGLAFIAAYLPRSPETDAWLASAVRQLGSEIDRQFTADGAHFEASTSYHRLSAEMAIYAAALILGLPADKRHALADYDHRQWSRQPPLASSPLAWPPFAPAVLSKLARAAHFAFDVTKPTGDIVQIGDGDSGRFLKLSPALDWTAGIPGERHLDVSSLIAAANGIFDTGLPAPPLSIVETEIVSALAGGEKLAVPGPRPAPSYRGDPIEDVAAQSATRIVIMPPQPDAMEGLERLAYPDFGLFIWRNARSFISIRCGPIGQNGNGGHAHNDQLAVEIEIDRVAWARDPGTFIYRPDFVARNQYRSALAHFVPRQGRSEPADLVAHFRLEDRAQARTLRFGPEGFLGMHRGFGFPIFRSLVIAAGSIVIEDCVAGPRILADTPVAERVVRSPQDLAALWELRLPFSPGYGLRQAA
jgi:hypothetical protein